MSSETNAQPAVAGEYYLRGVMEVGSGFLFNPDSTFQFFFSYGALDRQGSGQWSIKNKEVVLNSKPRPPHDFAMISSASKKSETVTIRVTDNNTFLIRYVHVKIKSGGIEREGMTNDKGEISFPARSVDSITLTFEFCPEKQSVFQADNKLNYFEFRFEPWIAEYFFRDFHLQIEGNDLKGIHPMLDEKEYLFEKRK